METTFLAKLKAIEENAKHSTAPGFEVGELAGLIYEFLTSPDPAALLLQETEQDVHLVDTAPPAA